MNSQELLIEYSRLTFSFSERFIRNNKIDLSTYFWKIIPKNVKRVNNLFWPFHHLNIGEWLQKDTGFKDDLKIRLFDMLTKSYFCINSSVSDSNIMII